MLFGSLGAFTLILGVFYSFLGFLKRNRCISGVEPRNPPKYAHVKLRLLLQNDVDRPEHANYADRRTPVALKKTVKGLLKVPTQ